MYRAILLFCKITNKSTITITVRTDSECLSSLTNTQTQYVPDKQDSNINIQIVYTATTQIDFVRIVTIMILHNFISNWTILML